MAIEVNLLMHHQVQMKSFYHGYKVANVILVVIFNGSDQVVKNPPKKLVLKKKNFTVLE
jgi:hypothetical protein